MPVTRLFFAPSSIGWLATDRWEPAWTGLPADSTDGNRE